MGTLDYSHGKRFNVIEPWRLKRFWAILATSCTLLTVPFITRWHFREIFSSSMLLEGPYIKQDFVRAYEESNGFFTDIRESDWNRLKERLRATPECALKCQPEAAEIWYQNNWEPGFTCQHERRIGRWGDGGKWVCDPHRITSKHGSQSCLVYSVGSNNDFSFEEAILKDISPDCEIHTFDPTVGEHPSKLPAYGNITFHPWGLGHEDHGAYKTLPSMIKELGHQLKEIDILKIDCEGCEWATFASWFEDGAPLSARQILIELHNGTLGPHDPPISHEFISFLREKGYVIFHKESNTLGCKGACIEFSFLRLNI